MAKYVGFCGPAITGPTEHGAGDVIGRLLLETPSGWVVAAAHMSSSPGYSQMDIRRHFDRRENPSDSDTYEWIGQQSDVDALMATYPPAPAPEEAVSNG